MRNRKNCLAVLLMTTIVVMGCGNQQVEKENSSAVTERASNVQDESEDGEKELFEEAKAEHPFQFISGLGTTLEDFENQITALSKGDKFDFTIPADKAYGQYDEQHVIDIPKNIFEIDGKFDSERIKEGNIVPLQTGDGQRVNASVVEIKPDVVVVDLNHTLAGADLIYEGEIIESRPATNEEIQELIKLMSGEGCGCGCDSCGGGCGDNECDDCGCEGGHCHK